MSIFDKIKNVFTQKVPLSPGVYYYVAPESDPLNYRLNLRIEKDGNGILIVNASTVLHLNATAAEYAYHILNQTPDEEVAGEIASRYRIKKKEALEDYQTLKDHIQSLIESPDLDPVTSFGFDRQVPYSEELSAPYRLDCALTYQLPEGSNIYSAPHKHVDRELTTEEWKAVMKKAFDASIPHLIFTGGEPTLRPDLLELLQYGEDLGLVTGILTDGIKLADTDYLHALLKAGLDHAMIILQPDKKASWDSLASFSYWSEALDEDIHVTAHITITEDNADKIDDLLRKISQTEVAAISLSTSSKKYSGILENARDLANYLGFEVIWDLPVPYCNINPINMELDGDTIYEDDGRFGMTVEEAHPSGAGRGWLYVEPDGDILPSQEINKVLGNFLKDDWETIWNSTKDWRKEK
ncbi:MAG: hypothetical protein JXA19_04395 [Anaerolineales bacterium]|nr:hypothetical protein [Anaerolineales bacterium]